MSNNNNSFQRRLVGSARSNVTTTTSLTPSSSLAISTGSALQQQQLSPVHHDEHHQLKRDKSRQHNHQQQPQQEQERVPLLLKVAPIAAEANRVTIHGEYAFEQPRQGVVSVDGIRLLMGQTTAGRELLSEEIRRSGFHEKRSWPRPPSTLDAEISKRQPFDSRIVQQQPPSTAPLGAQRRSAQQKSPSNVSTSRPGNNNGSRPGTAAVATAASIPTREMKKELGRVAQWQSKGTVLPEAVTSEQFNKEQKLQQQQQQQRRPNTSSSSARFALTVPEVPLSKQQRRKQEQEAQKEAHSETVVSRDEANMKEQRSSNSKVPHLFQDCVGSASALIYPAAGTSAASAAASASQHSSSLPPTRVPRQYWITREHAVNNTVTDSSGSVKSNFEMCSVPIFPSDKPVSRLELFALARTLDNLMEDRLGEAGFETLQSAESALATFSEQRGVAAKPGSVEAAQKYVEVVRTVTDIADIGLCEVVRHTAASCIERGSLLDQLRGMLVAIIGNLCDRADNDKQRMDMLRREIKEVEAERDAAKKEASDWRKIFYRVNALGGTSAGLEIPPGPSSASPPTVAEMNSIVEASVNNAAEQGKNQQQREHQVKEKQRQLLIEHSGPTPANSNFSESHALPARSQKSSKHRRRGAGGRSKRSRRHRHHSQRHHDEKNDDECSGRSSQHSSSEHDEDDNSDDDDNSSIDDEVLRERRAVFRWIDEQFDKRAAQARDLAAAAEKHAAVIKKHEAASLTSALGDLPVEDDADALEAELAQQPKSMYQVLVGLLSDVHGAVTAADHLADRMQLDGMALKHPERNVSVAVRRWRRLAQEVGRFKAENGRRIPIENLKVEFAQLPNPSVIDILFTLVEISSTLGELQLRLKAAANANVLDRVTVAPLVPPETPEDSCPLCNRVAPPPASWGGAGGAGGGRDSTQQQQQQQQSGMRNRFGSSGDLTGTLNRRSSSVFDGTGRRRVDSKGNLLSAAAESGADEPLSGRAHDDLIMQLGLGKYAGDNNNSSTKKQDDSSPPLVIELKINCSCCAGGTAPAQQQSTSASFRALQAMSNTNNKQGAAPSVSPAARRPPRGGGGSSQQQHQQQAQRNSIDMAGVQHTESSLFVPDDDDDQEKGSDELTDGDDEQSDDIHSVHTSSGSSRPQSSTKNRHLSRKDMRELERELRIEEEAAADQLKSKLLQSAALPAFLRSGSFALNDSDQVPSQQSSKKQQQPEQSAKKPSPKPKQQVPAPPLAPLASRHQSLRRTASVTIVSEPTSPMKHQQHQQQSASAAAAAASSSCSAQPLSRTASARRTSSSSSAPQQQQQQRRMSSRQLAAASKASREQFAGVMSHSTAPVSTTAPVVTVRGSGDPNSHVITTRHTALKSSVSGEFGSGFIAMCRVKFPLFADARCAKPLFLAGMELNEIAERKEKEEQHKKMLAMAGVNVAAATNNNNKNDSKNSNSKKRQGDSDEEENDEDDDEEQSENDKMAWPLSELLESIEECYDFFFEHGHGKSKDLGEFIASAAAQREKIAVAVKPATMFASCEKFSGDERVLNFIDHVCGRTSCTHLRFLLLATDHLHLRDNGADCDPDVPAKVAVTKVVATSEQTFDLSDAILMQLKEDLLRNCTPRLSSTDVQIVLDAPDFCSGAVVQALADRYVPLYFVQQIWRDLLAESTAIFKGEDEF